MAQYDPITIRNGLPSGIGTDTLKANRVACEAVSTSGLATGDVLQVSGTLTYQKALNTSTSPCVGVFDGVSNNIVRSGIVPVTTDGGVVLANGDTVYLSGTAGAVTNVKPTLDVLHELGVVVDAATKRVLLQPKPVVTLPPTPPTVWVLCRTSNQVRVYNANTKALLDTLTPANANPFALTKDSVGQVWVAGAPNVRVWNGKTRAFVGDYNGTPAGGYTGGKGIVGDANGHVWHVCDRTAYPGKVRVFDAITKAVLGDYDLKAPESKWARLDGLGQVWIINYGAFNFGVDHYLDIFNGATLAYVGAFWIDWYPRQPGYDPAHQEMWVCHGIPSPGYDIIKVKNCSTKANVATPTATSAPYGAAADALGNMWVCSYDENKVNYYNTTTKALLGSVATPAYPSCVAVDNTNNKVWVGCYVSSGNSVLCVIDAATKVVDGTYATGTEPVDIVVVYP